MTPRGTLASVFGALITAAALSADPQTSKSKPASEIAEGQRVFRFETFGDEVLWTDKLHLNEVVEKSVDPTTALKVGLKVDADVLPPGILQKVDLKSPATTVALLSGSGETVTWKTEVARPPFAPCTVS